MKTISWTLLAALSLSGCVSKTKYEAELASLDKVYTRIDHMTNGMNQMGSEINRLRNLQSGHKTENESIITKLRIDELQASDVTDELAAINEAAEAYALHHAAGESLVTHFGDLKTRGADAIAEPHIHFLADKTKLDLCSKRRSLRPQTRRS